MREISDKVKDHQTKDEDTKPVAEEKNRAQQIQDNIDTGFIN